MGLLAALLLALLVGGCSQPGGAGPAPPGPDGEPILQPDDLVDLTVYFRKGSGPGAHLEPVTREVAVTDDLPLRALQLLVAGPVDNDGADLRPTLPPSIRVLDVDIHDRTAVANLSAAAIRDAELVGDSPENEALALGSIVATLTEFPAIEAVEVLVEGQRSGQHAGIDVAAFWGGWGLSGPMPRDDSLVGVPADGDGVPELALLRADPQELGSSDAEAVAVTRLRVRERTTTARVIIELADADEVDTAAGLVPPTRAAPGDDGELVVEISRVRAYEGGITAGRSVELGRPGVRSLTVDTQDLPGRLRVVLDAGDAARYHLRELPDPTRIVIDVKK